MLGYVCMYGTHSTCVLLRSHSTYLLYFCAHHTHFVCVPHHTHSLTHTPLAIPKDLEFRLGFLQVYATFDEVSLGVSEVLESLIRDFPQSERAWGVWARQCIPEQFLPKQQRQANAGAHNRWRFESVLARFKRANAALPTESMTLEYVEYLLEQLYHSRGDAELCRSLTERVLSAFAGHHPTDGSSLASAPSSPPASASASSAASSPSSPEFYHRQLDVLLNLGLLERARVLLDQVLDSSALGEVASLWHRRLDLAMTCASTSELAVRQHPHDSLGDGEREAEAEVLELYARAVSALQAHVGEADRVWCAHFEYVFVGCSAALAWSQIEARIKVGPICVCVCGVRVHDLFLSYMCM
jgi:hypothetical protein